MSERKRKKVLECTPKCKKLKWNMDLVEIKKVKMNKKDNYNSIYKNNRYLNVDLYRIERYMRKHHLLQQEEYLEFVQTPQKGLRIELIDLISFEAGFIEKNRYLKLVY